MLTIPIPQCLERALGSPAKGSVFSLMTSESKTPPSPSPSASNTGVPDFSEADARSSLPLAIGVLILRLGIPTATAWVQILERPLQNCLSPAPATGFASVKGTGALVGTKQVVGQEAQEGVEQVFMQESDTSNFLKKHGKRSPKSRDKVNEAQCVRCGGAQDNHVKTEDAPELTCCHLVHSYGWAGEQCSDKKTEAQKLRNLPGVS
ncbi:putative cartilage matrix-associated protein [Manis javanica]|nr:putative cartilage matrix-associated protein [Manis javanica]